jgi:hypothetical protein
MGIAIANADEPPPCGIVVTLECDAADDVADFFCRGFETFQHADGFIGCHAAAMKAGWLERQSTQGRQWLCPACSGKS